MGSGKEILCCPIHTRVSQATYDRLEKLISKSNVQTMAELLRAIVQKEKINWYHKNAELEALALEFALIRKELNAIGKNINQVTKAYHQSSQPGQKLVQALKAESEYRKVESKVGELLKMMDRVTMKWSQK